ncbi:class I poly(R)-hydroxyalkanoic acid synthase [Halorhodospira abdelmalekii]|uniref:PHA/PHB synthase family protein n=1 Tax=Halorhodospira abdelmalekii TaxID=421629 RepID=UPI001902D697|nr:class I poly(R)-hydroxyalkanoic acid synthase [Halorhodospira abdelmalekii]MBK1733797.1 class I poly(R)-hydroxyalkanoic acid synthase [Halorhodospira abdelmalekii]
MGEERKGPSASRTTLRMTEHWQRIAMASSRLAAGVARRQLTGDFFTFPDPLLISRSYQQLGCSLLANPQALLGLQQALINDSFQLWQQSLVPGVAGEAADKGSAAAKPDRRFQHAAWLENSACDFIRRSYQMLASRTLETAQAAGNLEPQTQRMVEFYTRQYVDALSPTNFALTNPAVVERAIETGGESLLCGLANILEDLADGDGQLRLRHVDPNAFEIGHDLASTPGRVVFENRLMQLIQYSPTTETVHQRPLLIVPPWINKFYILDLNEKKSWIRWAVAQGHTVFVISWVNPGAELAETTFDDYLTEGPVAALDAIRDLTGAEQVNAVGYCIGGTLLATTLAWLAAGGEQERIVSATFLTTMLDFSEVGELAVFIDDEQITQLEQHMTRTGYLQGALLGQAFNLLQANDLIWGYVINNYLLGREPVPFDLLYWNGDNTCMPARMQSWYLRNLYLENRLREPNALELAGRRIDLGKVKTPAYFLSTAADHIAPWRSTYRSARLLAGPVRFVLGGSGHVAGVINPENSGKYGYRTHNQLLADPEAWLAAAQEQSGSWWPDWRAWVEGHAGERVAARTPAPGIEPAPGRYVKVRAPKGAAV